MIRKRSLLRRLWNQLLGARRPIILPDGDRAELVAFALADELIEGNWPDARVPSAARRLIVAAILHVHESERGRGRRVDAGRVIKALSEAPTPRDFLLRMQGAESHRFAVAVARDLLGLDDTILAQVFYEADVCLGRAEIRPTPRNL